MNLIHLQMANSFDFHLGVPIWLQAPIFEDLGHVLYNSDHNS